MQSIKMCYKGFVFDTNPTELKINKKKGISKKTVPFGISKVSEISSMPAVISGKGAFYGADAFEKAGELMRIFDSPDSAYLFIPPSFSAKAIFSSLDVSYCAAGNKVEYVFEFIQDTNNKKNQKPIDFTYALKDENMYDIAHRCSSDIEGLFLNNDYEDLFSVEEGDKIWLG